jgi:hypothetical protein
MSLKRINISEDFWRGVKEHVLELLAGDILQAGVALIKPGERHRFRATALTQRAMSYLSCSQGSSSSARIRRR